jgi:hypothetical protein
MTDAMKSFVNEIRLHGCPDEADQFEVWFTLVENSHNKRIRLLGKAIEWIVSRTEHSFADRLSQLIRLAEIKTPAVFSMKLFTGWN